MKKLSADYIFPGNGAPIKNGVIVIDDDGAILSVLTPNIDEINWGEVGVSTAPCTTATPKTVRALSLSYALGHHQSHLTENSLHFVDTTTWTPLHRTDSDVDCRGRRKEFSKIKKLTFFTVNFLPFSAGKDGVCCYSPARVKFLKRKFKSRLVGINAASTTKNKKCLPISIL